MYKRQALESYVRFTVKTDEYERSVAGSVFADGRPKIVRELGYPATARGKVAMIFTDLPVIEVTPQGLKLLEVCPGLSAADVQSVTEPTLIVAPDLREIEL